MGNNKNKIRNNIIKLFFTVAFSVSVPERGLTYPTFHTFSLEDKGFAEKALTNLVSRAIIEVPRRPSVT